MAILVIYRIFYSDAKIRNSLFFMSKINTLTAHISVLFQS